MKTFTLLYTKIFSGIILILILPQSLICQNGKSISASAGDRYSESKKLSDESEKFSKQAAEIRVSAASVTGDGQKLMLEEAESLEREAMLKNVESLKLDYLSLEKKHIAKDVAIQDLQKKSKPAKNAQHIKFLIDQNSKNYRSSHDLFVQGGIETVMVFKIGSLENANETILAAIKQQDEVIMLLKDESRGKK